MIAPSKVAPIQSLPVLVNLPSTQSGLIVKSVTILIPLALFVMIVFVSLSDVDS